MQWACSPYRGLPKEVLLGQLPLLKAFLLDCHPLYRQLYEEACRRGERSKQLRKDKKKKKMEEEEEEDEEEANNSSAATEHQPWTGWQTRCHLQTSTSILQISSFYFLQCLPCSLQT
jgi:hypothetical protein